jgi:hypothetical protein
LLQARRVLGGSSVMSFAELKRNCARAGVTCVTVAQRQQLLAYLREQAVFFCSMFKYAWFHLRDLF